MGMYDTFLTDQDLETHGVYIDYGDFRVKIASAGQGNKAYVKYAERKLKPVRRAIDAGSLGQARSEIIMSDIYAVTIIQGWEVKAKGKDEWKSGIEGQDGKIMTVNKENVIKTLLALPRLFSDLQEQAASLSNFRKAEIEEDSGN